MPVAPKRSILIALQGGKEMIVEDIPSNAKITFGALNPGSKDYGPSRDTAVRIYTTAGNQLAVFRNAESFRDLALTVKVRAVKTASSESVESNSKGVRRQAASTTEFEWEQV